MPSIIANNKIILSVEEIQFINDNWQHKTNLELSIALGLKLSRTRTFLYEMGIKRMELEYWNVDQVDYLKDNFHIIGDVELAKIFNENWPKIKLWTKKHIEKKRNYLKLFRTKEQLVNIKKRNINAGSYKHGLTWKSRGVNQIGTILIWKGQYDTSKKVVVIKTQNGYVGYNRWLWIKHNGGLPSDLYVILKQGLNLSGIPKIEDLEIITRQEHAKRNSQLRMEKSPEISEIIKIRNKLTKSIKIIKNETRNRK